MNNYVFNSIDNENIKGDKPLEVLKVKKNKIKKPKVIKIKKLPRYVFRNKRKLWNIPENF